MSKHTVLTTETVYHFVHDYIQAHRIAPSIREIAEGTYIGRSTVVRHLDRLEALGRIIRTPGRARSIRLITHEDE